VGLGSCTIVECRTGDCWGGGAGGFWTAGGGDCCTGVMITELCLGEDWITEVGLD